MPSLMKEFTGSSLVLDPETGYLTNSTVNSLTGFNATRKQQFVEFAREWWPNIMKICEAVGITHPTFYSHYAVDPKFRADIDACRERILDNAEHVMAQRAMAPGGFMDRIAMLKAYRPARWDQERRYRIVHESAAQTHASDLQAIDAELVQPPMITGSQGETHQPPSETEC